MRLPDWLYITRARAISLGYTHEGTHFGVPVWVEDDPIEGLSCATKLGILEVVVDFGSILIQFANRFRAPGDEILFGFLIRPIEQGPER